MAKVRVPVEMRAPKRFGKFNCKADNGRGTFRVVGVYRTPKEGEWIWTPPDCFSDIGMAHKAQFDFEWQKCVILERVK